MEFKKPIYPIEQWNITETEFEKENNYRNEVWKETSSTAFMKAMRSAMERRILVHRF